MENFLESLLESEREMAEEEWTDLKHHRDSTVIAGGGHMESMRKDVGSC